MVVKSSAYDAAAGGRPPKQPGSKKKLFGSLAGRLKRGASRKGGDESNSSSSSKDEASLVDGGSCASESHREPPPPMTTEALPSPGALAGEARASPRREATIVIGQMSGSTTEQQPDRSPTATTNVPKARSFLFTNKKALHDPEVRKEVTRLYNLIHQVDRTTSLASIGAGAAASSNKKLMYASTKVTKSGGYNRSDGEEQSLGRQLPPRKLRVIKCPTVERSGNPFDREDLSSLGSALGHSKISTKKSPSASASASVSLPSALSSSVMRCLGMDSRPSDSGRKRTLTLQDDGEEEEDSGINAPSEVPQPGNHFSPPALCGLFSSGSMAQEKETEERAEPPPHQDSDAAKERTTKSTAADKGNGQQYSTARKEEPPTRASSWLWNVFEESVSVALSQETGPDPLIGFSSQGVEHEAGENKERCEGGKQSEEARDDEPEYDQNDSEEVMDEPDAAKSEIFYQYDDNAGSHRSSSPKSQKRTTKKKENGQMKDAKQVSSRIQSNEAACNFFWFRKSKQPSAKEAPTADSAPESHHEKETRVFNSKEVTNRKTLIDVSEKDSSENYEAPQESFSPETQSKPTENADRPLTPKRNVDGAGENGSLSRADLTESTKTLTDAKQSDDRDLGIVAEKPELKARRSSRRSTSIKRTPSLISVKSMRTLVSTTSGCDSDNAQACRNDSSNKTKDKVRAKTSSRHSSIVEPATGAGKVNVEPAKQGEKVSANHSSHESYLLGFLLAQLAFHKESEVHDKLQSNGLNDERVLDLKDGMTLSEIMLHVQDHHAPRLSKGYLTYILKEFARHACTVDRTALQKGYAERLCKRPAALPSEAGVDATLPPDLWSATTSAIKDAANPSIDDISEEMRQVSDLQVASSSIESSPTQASEEITASGSCVSDDESGMKLVVRVHSNSQPAKASTHRWSWLGRDYTCCGPVSHANVGTGEDFEVIADAVEATIEALREDDAEGSSTGSSEVHWQDDAYEDGVGAWFSFLDGKEESYYSSVDEGDEYQEIEEASLTSDEGM